MVWDRQASGPDQEQGHHKAAHRQAETKPSEQDRQVKRPNQHHRKRAGPGSIAKDGIPGAGGGCLDLV
jgi:hypothetical protein